MAFATAVSSIRGIRIICGDKPYDLQGGDSNRSSRGGHPGGHRGFLKICEPAVCRGKKKRGPFATSYAVQYHFRVRASSPSVSVSG
jgi:hypothetical protein